MNMKGKHLTWMGIACIALMAVAFLFPKAGGISGLLFLACPLLHLLMVFGLLGKAGCCKQGAEREEVYADGAKSQKESAAQ